MSGHGNEKLDRLWLRAKPSGSGLMSDTGEKVMAL